MSDDDTADSPQDQTRRLTEEELRLVPFDFTQVVYNETNSVYEAVFQGDDIFTPELPTDNSSAWLYYGDNQEALTPKKYREKHPGIQYIEEFDTYTGFATYRNRQVQWSELRNTWLYTNNHPVNFEEDEVALSLLSEPPETPERPTSPRATSSRWPDPVTPTPQRQFQTLATILETPGRPRTAPGLPTPVTQRPVTPHRTLTPPLRPTTPS